jgi:hypothetical protein
MHFGGSHEVLVDVDCLSRSYQAEIIGEEDEDEEVKEKEGQRSRKNK